MCVTDCTTSTIYTICCTCLAVFDPELPVPFVRDPGGGAQLSEAVPPILLELSLVHIPAD